MLIPHLLLPSPQISQFFSLHPLLTYISFVICPWLLHLTFNLVFSCILMSSKCLSIMVFFFIYVKACSNVDHPVLNPASSSLRMSLISSQSVSFPCRCLAYILLIWVSKLIILIISFVLLTYWYNYSQAPVFWCNGWMIYCCEKWSYQIIFFIIPT